METKFPKIEYVVFDMDGKPIFVFIQGPVLDITRTSDRFGENVQRSRQ